MPVKHPTISPEQRLRAFLEGTAVTTGEAFFRATVQHLARALDVAHAFIAQCTDGHRTRVRTLAFWQGDDYGANVEYNVARTPCEAVMQGESVCHADDVQHLFPTDANLRALGVCSYVAVPVHDSSGTVVGHLGALDRHPMSEDHDHWILRVFAARAGAEYERLRAERLLQASKAHARNLLDLHFDGIVVAVDGRIAYANKAAWKLAGCHSVEDLLGRSPADLIVEEQREFVLNQIAVAMAGDGKIKPTECLVKKVDGSTMPVEMLGRRIAFRGRPALLAAVRDVTARHIVERERSRAQAELRRVLEAVPDLIWSGDVSSAGIVRLRWASPVLERLTGRPPTFFQGDQIPWLSIVHPADRKQFEDAADRLIRGERDDSEQEYRIVRPDGTVRWVRDRVVVTEGADGGHSIQGVISDITEGRVLIEQLARAQKLKSVGQLAAGIAHNFNNTLTAISGYSELLLSRCDADDPTRAGLEAIQRSSEQAEQLVGQLLTFSRQATSQPTEFNLNDAVETTHSLLGPLMGDKTTIRLRLDPSVPTVRSDRAQTEQIVTDLLLNARDAMPDGGVVTLETRAVTVDHTECERDPDAELGDYTRLCVTDTGSGMDEQTAARVFEPFFTTKESGKGVGLGLAMVHGAAKQNGGFVTVTSTPGRGTTFELYLPTAGTT